MAKQRNVRPEDQALAEEQKRMEARDKRLAAERARMTKRGEMERLIYRGKCEDCASAVELVRTSIHQYEVARSGDPDPALKNFAIEGVGGTTTQHIVWAKARGWGRLAVGHIEFTRMGEHRYEFELWRYGNTVTDSTPDHNSLIDYKAITDFFSDLGGRLARAFGPHLTEPHAGMPYVPTKPTVLNRWKVTWRYIRARVQSGDTPKAIGQWLTKTHPQLPHSEDTLREIIVAGEAGQLD